MGDEWFLAKFTTDFYRNLPKVSILRILSFSLYWEWANLSSREWEFFLCLGFRTDSDNFTLHLFTHCSSSSFCKNGASVESVLSLRTVDSSLTRSLPPQSCLLFLVRTSSCQYREELPERVGQPDCWHDSVYMCKNVNMVCSQMEFSGYADHHLVVAFIFMSRRKVREPKEETTTLGPAVRDGEHVFGVAHIFASFNDTFIQEFGITALHIKLPATGGHKTKTPGLGAQSALKALALPYILLSNPYDVILYVISEDVTPIPTDSTRRKGSRRGRML
ncbi:hypothetical protein J1N35_001395 [Gossypium stocksii]|uniref:Uncharacterized protein n=1 Tax=Gossypium stocksii TaxID=47602 RepID=A0A9D3WHK4_9ROSI|nr:hypothetical protein J1N35_001395 [Gossypium stocksii]